MSYIDLKYRPSNRDLVCSFFLEPEHGLSLRKVAENVAAESSTGTWTHVHTSKPYVGKLAAKVFDIRGNRIRISYPQELFESGNVPQILSSVAGNVFGMKIVKNLRLEDIAIPRGVARSFKGPRFGVDGIRKLFGIKNRPLLGTIIKPKLGLRTADHARVAYEAWTGGCDLVKDDENLTSQDFNPFRKRVQQTLRMRERAERETGETKAYLPNVTAETGEMLRRAKFVKDRGGRYVMVDIISCGWSGLQTLREQGQNVVIHAHRAGHAAMTRDPKHGISMLVIAKLSRLIGVDQLHIGTVVGKMESEPGEVAGLQKALVQEWPGIKPVLSVCSGGLHPGLMPKLVKMLGRDIIIQMGGGIHGHSHGTGPGARAARQAIEAVTFGKNLADYARKHGELAEALKKWGTK